MINVNKISDYQLFTEIRSDWAKLFTESGSTNFFLSWEWTDACWKSQAFPQEEPWIITVYQDTRLVGIAPFARSRFQKNNLTFYALTQIGNREADSGCFLILPETEDIITRNIFIFLAEHRHEWDFFELYEVPANECYGEKVRKLYPERYKLLVTQDIQFELPLKRTWEEIYQALSKNTQFNYRKKIRLFSEAGSISNRLYYHETIPAEVIERVREIRHQGAYPDLYDNSKYFDFISRLLTENVPSGNAYINLLLFKDEPIAFIFGFVQAGLITYWQGTYNKRFSGYSPGFINLAGTITSAVEDPKLLSENLTRFSFLRGEQNYKTLFRPEKSIYEIFRVVKPSLKTFFGIIFPLYFRKISGKEISQFGSYKFDFYNFNKTKEAIE